MKARQITFLFIFLLAMYLCISAAAAASFSDLNTAINSDESVSVVYLNENYTYNADSDSEYATSVGIRLSKNITIDGQGHTIDAGGQTRIFNTSYASNVILKNITFINGYAPSAGAILGQGNISIIDCTFINNTAESGAGGALLVSDNKLRVIENSTFKDNNAAIYGGAIYTGNNATILNSTFENNSAYYAGVLYAEHNITILNSVFDGNTAEDGFIYVGDDLNVSDSIFRNNTASIGGIFHARENANITGSYFENNQASVGTVLYVEQTAAFLNYNVILDKNAIYNSVSGNINADLNWWGTNSPNRDNFGNNDVDNYYVMTLSSGEDAPEFFGDSFTADYKFQSNTAGKIGLRAFILEYVFKVPHPRTFENAPLLPEFKTVIKNNGVVAAEIDGRESASIALEVTRIGENIVEAVSHNEAISFTFNIEKAPANLQMTLSEETVFAGDIVEITVAATDDAYNPIAGNADIFVNDKFETRLNLENGIGIYEYTPNQAGIFEIKSVYEENNRFLSAQADQILTVNDLSSEPPTGTRPIPTELTLTLSQNTIQLGSTAEIEIQLNGRGQPLRGRDIVIEINNETYMSKTTDVAGKLNAEFKPAELGEFQIRAVFEGNNLYVKSNDTAVLKVVSEPVVPRPPEPETPDEVENPHSAFEIVFAICALLVIAFILSRIFRRRTMKKAESEENDKFDDK